MPKKTKKKLKSRKVKSAGARSNEDDVNPLDQEQSFMSNDPIGAQTSNASKMKKGKKKAEKLTPAEKRLIKLEKGVEKLKSNNVMYEHYLEAMDLWLQQYGERCVTLFSEYDVNNDGVVTYDEFKSGLYDMNCPCNAIEIHITCKLLDGDNSGDIEYSELSKGLRWFIKQSIEEDGVDGEFDDDNMSKQLSTLVLSQSAKDIAHCPCCKLGVWEHFIPPTKYIELTMMLITFADTVKNHPCHFTRLVHSHLTIYGLIQLIKHEVGIQSNTLAVFRDKSRSPEAEIQHHMTLDECGLDGRDWYNPIEHILFYDYTSEFNQCPILMCDHYFVDQS